jgi:hypothetical protein
MTNLEEHKRKIQEHLKEIKDAIDEGLENKPITLGFHTSACAVELLEMYLHQLNLISAGKTIKHNWFERPKPEQKIMSLIERKLPVDFPDKDQIYGWMYNIEEHRDSLIYGRNSPAETRSVLENFLQLKKRLTEKIKELGEEIE